MLLTLALLAAAPALDDGAAATPKPKKEARVCRRVGTTGSRMDEKRVCMAKAEWVRIDAANNVHGIDADHTNDDERKRGNK